MSRFSLPLLIALFALALSGCADEFVAEAPDFSAATASEASQQRAGGGLQSNACSLTVVGADTIYHSTGAEQYTLSNNGTRCRIYTVEWEVVGGARIVSANQPWNVNPAFANVEYYRPTYYSPWNATITATITVLVGEDNFETFTQSKTVQVRVNPPPPPTPQTISVSAQDGAALSVNISWGPYASIPTETYTACVTRDFSGTGPLPRPPDLPCTTLSSVTDSEFYLAEDTGYFAKYKVQIRDSQGTVIAVGESSQKLIDEA